MAGPRKGKAPAGPVPVEATKHADTRVNIPTGELADFVADAEKQPGATLYPRDPTLDPQLVWRGKDDQDLAEHLRVASVPIYIQEKLEPQALVENLRDTAAAGEAEPELSLFDDFDGLPFEDLVDFYAHEGNWSNRMILGDSLLVMNSLAEKERVRGKVQMVFLDPPYGIKFGSNWQVSTRKREVSDGKDVDVTRQPEQIKAFRDTWELGIHSYLAYLRDRLTVTRELLTESGSCFVQIGDENVHLVRSLMDEVFGSENFVSMIVAKTTSGAGSPSGGTLTLAGVNDYVLWYAKDGSQVKYRQLYGEKAGSAGGANLYRRVREVDGMERPAQASEVDAPESLPPGARLFRPADLTSQSSPESSQFPVEIDGHSIRPGKGGWKTNVAGMERLRLADRLFLTSNKTLRYVRFLDDFPAYPFNNVWTDVGTGSFTDPKVYVVQTNTKIIQRCMLMTTDPGDLVLDPTCGSGTTAYVAEQWGRRWITVDTSRVALALARTRLMCARYPYYLLADSPEGAKKEGELAPEPASTGPFAGDVRKGFVYRRVPHITLKSIAQNPDIREGMSRAEVDAAIARHAESELLVDQPFEDRRRVRVTGRFTVESLSPHRVLDEERPPPTASEAAASDDATTPSFEQTILDNLRKAGVHNTFRGEEIRFDRLDAYAGTWIQAEGEFTDAGGEVRRVAVAIGPEHGTVGPDQVKEAAKEAMRGAGFDLLVTLGFAFDPHAGETAREFAPAGEGLAVAAEERRLGRLRILLGRMNPDLAMGGDLLKKTGAGNLFMVFGEPDLEITPVEGGRLAVELRGVDVYDPTTGEVRSGSTDDVACWFVDTAYNGESFFVRHAYFTGGNDPYAQLRRALRADIDEEAWTSLYATGSRPFPVPDTGRIAVKVINHYGDEVMQVYEVTEG
ncbi:MAG: site-specific DNA-methyltransferase [Acidimicrobiales bacterium]